MELTLEVRQSTIDAIKAYAADNGDTTELVNETASNAIESILKHGPLVAFQLRPSTVQMLQGYAHLVGTSKEEAAVEVSEALSAVLEDVLKDKIGRVLGFKNNPVPVAKVARRHRQPPRPTHQDTTGISDGLGDDDLDPEMPLGETSAEALVPAGGLTDEELAKDMAIEDANTEAKADAGSFGEMMAQGNGEAEDLFASEVGYVDARIAKRKKGPTKSRGKVKSMTESVLTESPEL